MANLPDQQHVYLDALYTRIQELHDEGTFTDSDLQFLHQEEPESHVFSGDDLDYNDPDESAEIINLVGGRDLDDKIRYWERVIREA